MNIVLAPKYRRQIIYGKIKTDIRKILRELCDRKDIEIIEATLSLQDPCRGGTLPPDTVAMREG